MKLLANSWNSMSSIHGIPSRVNVKAVGSHSGSGTRESSAGIRSCSSCFCLRSRAGHVAKKWVGSSIPCAQSLQVEEPTSSSPLLMSREVTEDHARSSHDRQQMGKARTYFSMFQHSQLSQHSEFRHVSYSDHTCVVRIFVGPS